MIAHSLNDPALVGGLQSDVTDGACSYIRLIVPSTSVSASLVDFPVYVDLSDAPDLFHNNVQTDGGDIRVTTEDGKTRRPVDVVSIDPGAKTGHIFFSGSLSSVADTTFLIWFDPPDTVSQPSPNHPYGRSNVWQPAGFKAVYHMDGDPSFGHSDASGNGNLASSYGNMNYLDEVPGVLGNATTFDGVDDYMETNQAPLASPDSPWHMTAWVRPNNTVITAFGLRTDDGSEYVGLRETNAGLIKVVTIGKTPGEGTTVLDWDWQRWELEWDGAAFSCYLGKAFEYSVTPTSSAWISGLNRLLISDPPGGAPWNGELDEVRLRTGIASTAWREAEVNNQTSPSSFYSLVT